MSFRFSSAGSSFTVSSDFSSEVGKSSKNRTLGETGARIMNSSYPLVNKRVEFRRDNETFAYLEKIKNLNLGENRIEHIHHMRYLDQLDYSFKKSGKNLNAYARDRIVEVGYKEGEGVKSEGVKKEMPEHVRKARVRVGVNGSEYGGVVLPFGFVLTAGVASEDSLKKARVFDFENKLLSINKLGVFLSTPDFSLLSITEQGTEGINPFVQFKLSKTDEIFVPATKPEDPYTTPLPTLNYPLQIVDITDKYFAFSSRTMENYQQALPVFSKYWELQGLYSHSLLNLHFVLRLEPIFSYLLRTQPEILSDEFDKLLSFYTRFFSSPLKKNYFNA